MMLRSMAVSAHSDRSKRSASRRARAPIALLGLFLAAAFACGCGPSTPTPLKSSRPAEIPGAKGSAAQLRWVSLPGGTFTMGENVVTVAPFRMDRFEVTVLAYSQCVNEKQCPAIASGAAGCNRLADGQYEQPRNCVTFADATAYCAWSGMRLPTQEEWEWAARGQSAGTTFPWGNQPPTDDQLCWKQASGTCLVGSFPKSDAPGGIHDLAGNVWEWTSSLVPGVAASYVIRGGSWRDTTLNAVAATSARPAAPDDRFPQTGFRCVR
jgi:formylglycine-generating enzyme required for sulfatase activity